MKRAIKITTLTLVVLLTIIVGIWFINFEIPNIQQRSINDNTLDSVSFYEKAANEIILNFDTLKIQYKRPYENAYLDCIAEIHRFSVDGRPDSVDKQKYIHIDSVLSSKLANSVFINADSSIYFLTDVYSNSSPGRESYAHFICFDNTSSLKFIKSDDIVKQQEIKPNWTYAVIRIY